MARTFSSGRQTTDSIAIAGVLVCVAPTLHYIGVPLWIASVLSGAAFAVVIDANRRHTVIQAIKPIDAIYKQLERALERAADMEAIAAAQSHLDKSMSRLRELAYGHGDPRMVGGDLLFGEFQIGGSDSLVDQVRVELGGAATIFCGDRRISTNVRDGNGRRVTDTRLEDGPARQALFGAQSSYCGEVLIFGDPYVAIYEPIICGEDVIGALFVAVRTQEVLSAGLDPKDRCTGDRFIRMSQLLAVLEGTMANRYDDLLKTNARRSEALDARRKVKAVERAYALRQLDEAHALHCASVSLEAAIIALSRRTERQAGTLDETTRSLGLITKVMKETSKSIRDAREIADGARREAQQSDEVVQHACSAMGRIALSSLQIGQIVNVIDEIAEQTQTSCRSTQQSKPREPAQRATVFPSSPPKSGCLPKNRQRRRARSKFLSRYLPNTSKLV